MIMSTGTKKQTQKMAASGFLNLAVNQIGKVNARYLGCKMTGAMNRRTQKSATAYAQSALCVRNGATDQN